jgi:pilus assembly protein CpaF
MSLFENTVTYYLRPILHLLEDPQVSEVLINGPDTVFVEVRGRLQRVEGVAFSGEEELRAACTNVAQYSNKVYDPQHPRFDGRLPDGSRVHVIGPPVAPFMAMAIRKFQRASLGPKELVELGSLSAEAMATLRAAIQMKRNLLISGGTGSGKTTLLTVLAGYISSAERIVVMEDTKELQIDKPHVVQLEARLPDQHGRGEVTIRDLLHSTLRLRPDRIIVGEVRGGEALDLLNTLNSGHGGTMTTLHANSAMSALSKLETLVLFAGEDMPIRAIRGQVADAVDMVVQVSRFPDGSRRVEQVAEVFTGLDEHGNYRINTLFQFEGQGMKDGKLLGGLIPTQRLPSFYQRALGRGVKIDKRWFIPKKAKAD